MATRFTWDLVERLGWTGAEAVAALAVTEFADLDVWWAAPLAAGFALLKGAAAKHLGVRGTASTLPAVADPAGAGRPPVSGL